MLAAVFSFTKRGRDLAKKIGYFLNSVGYQAVVWTMPKYEIEGAVGYPTDYRQVAAEAMQKCQAIVFVGATGICVRAIAPYLRDKTVDPAIISVDERANFIIPLIAGHIGGANEIARQMATYIGATACVTTATDVNGLFAVDEWAARNNIAIGNMTAAKELATALVNGEGVGLVKDDTFTIKGALPKLVSMSDACPVGMALTVFDNVAPFATTLQLFPKAVHLGIGCKRNTPLEKIEALVLMVMQELQLDMRSVKALASVDLKKDEQGLLAFAEKYGIEAHFYTAEELNAVEGEFSVSSLVQRVVGVGNVCERSAVKDSNYGKVLLHKTSLNGVTCAIAVEHMQLDFSKTGIKNC